MNVPTILLEDEPKAYVDFSNSSPGGRKEDGRVEVEEGRNVL